MRIAFLSGIHGNADALEAVLDDIDKRRHVDKIYVLGDVIGYGPEPQKCIELVKEKSDMTLRGNQERAVLLNTGTIEGEVRKEIVEWNKRILTDLGRNEITSYGFAGTHTVDERTLVFFYDKLPGIMSPEVANEKYLEFGSIKPTDADFFDAYDILDSFTDSRILIGGFSMHQAIYHERGFMKAKTRIRDQEQRAKMRYTIPGMPILVTPGNVGRPQENSEEKRARYAILDFNGEIIQGKFSLSSGKVQFHRIPYDHKKTLKKIGELDLSDEAKEFLKKSYAT